MIKDMLSTVTTTPREVVLSFIKGLNEEDFDTAQKFVSNDMEFAGVLGSRNGAKAYFDDMRSMKFKYDIIKTFEDHNDVCLLYNVSMAGQSIFCCGWYRVEKEKITSIKVVFDPRPLLEPANRK
jgi:limonene-1,2-epoxide hydrolase